MLPLEQVHKVWRRGVCEGARREGQLLFGRSPGLEVCGENGVFFRFISRASVPYLAAHASYRAAVCLLVAHIAALWAFWTDWYPR